MEQREPNKQEMDLVEIVAGLQLGAARAIAALAEAVAKQPGIDREKLLDDWFAIIPSAEQAGRIDGNLYKTIDALLTSGHAVVPGRPVG